MRVAKCENGHYFYAEKEKVCPRCGSDEYALIGDKPKPDKSKKGLLRSRKARQKKRYEKEVDDIKKPEVKTVPKLEKMAVMEEAISEQAATVPVDITEDVKTIFYGRMEELDIEPVTGWLVCIEGSNKGNYYEIRNGRNKIGRATDMDIRISGDNSISRDTHATIVYDPKNKDFYLLPGISSNLVYLNDELLLENRMLESRDKIVLGNTGLVFVPFCTKEYNWD